ncbi:MFS transporter [Streptomyces sp. NBC_01369]|uniref:MFS transporter n=1 Tax=Streptomyces sp. NBC_01369 TaxID=2903842 RepID=UPI003247CB94
MARARTGARRRPRRAGRHRRRLLHPARRPGRTDPGQVDAQASRAAAPGHRRRATRRTAGSGTARARGGTAHPGRVRRAPGRLLAAARLGQGRKARALRPSAPDDQRLAANSVLSTSLWSATIAGPALAGLLVGVVSPAWIIGLDAATFAVLALQTGRITLPRTPAPPVTGSTQRGLSILRRQPELFGLLLVTWVFNLAFGPVEVALPLFVSDDLDAGAGLLGAYWAAFGIGAVIGALALGAARRLPLWPAMLGIIAGHGIGMLPFALTDTALPSLIGFAFAGLIYGPYSALSFTLIQDRAPADSLTTVLAARSAVLLTASPLGAALRGFLLDRTSAPAVLVGCGALMTLTVPTSIVVLKLHGERRRRHQPSHVPAERARCTD